MNGHSSSEDYEISSVASSTELKKNFELFDEKISKFDKISEHMRHILELLNPDCSEEIITKTPSRFARAMMELTDGYNRNSDDLMSAVFDAEDYNDIVIVRDINFSSICEHHLLPFFGTCSIGYIPDKKILGLSKFPRLVDYISRKMQLQERLTKEIGDFINKKLAPAGCIVIVEATHSCMCFRGIRAYGSKTETMYTSGVFKEKENFEKFFYLVNRKF